MNGSTLAALLALALLGAGLAGCIEAPEWMAEQADETSALAHRDAVERAALAWDDGARLLGVATLETRLPQEHVPLDPEVGNGLAPAWVYAYEAPDGAKRVFRVAADGTLELVEQDLPTQEASAPAVTAWAVDSDAALEAARADERFAAPASAPNATFAFTLFEGPAGTTWSVVAAGPSGVALAKVDAAAGALLSVESMPMAYAMEMAAPHYASPMMASAEPVHVEDDGTLDASDDAAEYGFEWAGGEGEARLWLEIATSLPGEHVRWSVVHLDDEDVVAEGSVWPSWDGGHATVEESFPIEEAGDYALVLEYGSWTQWSPLGLGETHYAFTLDVA